MINFLKRTIFAYEWQVGIIDSFTALRDVDFESDIKWVKSNYKDGWFADPFILEFNNKSITILVEELYYATGRGRISKIVVDRVSWEIISVVPILELDTHLSFPLIFKTGDSVYVCPENSKSGGWNLYSYNSESESLDFIKEIVDIPLTDATYIKINDVTYILSTKLPDPNGKRLSIYRCEKDLFGEIEFDSTIEFEENIARNAGVVFTDGDSLIRPAQECNQTYGRSISFQKMTKENGVFKFEEVKRVRLKNRNTVAFHTFNVCDSLVALDRKVPKCPFIFKLSIYILQKIKK